MKASASPFVKRERLLLWTAALIGLLPLISLWAPRYTLFINLAFSLLTYANLLNLYLYLTITKSLLSLKPVKNSSLKKNSVKHLKKLLKSAQQKLILQEKMASLGILSAGIAHEIKNPLNFINNFSETTIEMLQELKEALQNHASSENIYTTIEEIAVNCAKINEHGKRAESIIQNMLTQARTSTVERSELDVNTLLEEYLNLAYHGMRALNNRFNIKIVKNLQSNLPKVMGSSQSIGRVFLNIINNGLYAANEKALSCPNDAFTPTITLISEQDEQYVIIKIKDNGNGIPEYLRQKIFEPFFTTKPNGQGTGLGLHICYDIIIEHHGLLEINTRINEFSEFIIKLPKRP